MSHGLVLVIVPASTVDIAAYASESLAPFDPQNADRRSRKWDWWEIGRRFDRALSNPSIDVSAVESKRQDDAGLVGRNLYTIATLPAVKQWSVDALPWAVVTPDGRWVDRTTTRTNVADDMPWRVELSRLLSQFPNDFVLGIDIHF